MSGEKLSPRQKMIGMMYLVLTAMLALNISKEVLQGFVKVNNKLGMSNKTINSQSNAIWTSFQNKYSSNQEKVGPFYEKAQEVIEKSDEMIKYIKNMQAFSLASSEKKVGRWEEYIAPDENLGTDTVLNIDYVSKKDEYQELSARLVGANPRDPKTADDKSPFTALDVKNNLVGFKDYLAGVRVTTFNGLKWEPSPGFVQGIEKAFNYPDGEEDGIPKTWEAINFFDVPLAAVITYLSSLQLDVENAKANMLAEMLGGVEGKDYKFTNLRPLVIPQSNYIMQGDTFRAGVILAAYDASNPPRIYLDSKSWDHQDSSAYQPAEGESPIDVRPDGFGDLKISTRGLSLGDQAFKGMIKYLGPSGEWEDWPFIVPDFTVAQPALVVEPLAMNVFYRGLDNPVSIAVPGVPSDKISASCPGHTLRKGSKSGEWIVKPGSGREANISVRASMPDGTDRSFPAKLFRVKPIPDPVPEFGGRSPQDNTISRGDFSVTAGVLAKMKDFEFDVSVKVHSFTMSFTRGGEYLERKSTSNAVTSEMKGLMQNARRGEKVYIEDIMVKMPDGTTRKLSNLAFKIT